MWDLVDKVIANFAAMEQVESVTFPGSTRRELISAATVWHLRQTIEELRTTIRLSSRLSLGVTRAMLGTV